MDKHVTVLGVLFIASGVLGLVIALIIFWAMAGGALFSGDMNSALISTTIASLIGGFIALFSVPEIIAGIGLLYRKNWARILALVLSVLSLIEIPFGTIIGIYGLWVLLKQETIDIFEPRRVSVAVTPQAATQ